MITGATSITRWDLHREINLESSRENGSEESRRFANITGERCGCETLSPSEIEMKWKKQR